jgi:FtsZ-binding cell division protein ZapB
VINKEKMSEFCDGQKYSKDEQEMCKYTYISHDDKNLFAYDNEFSKFVTIPYSVDEEDEEKFSVDMEGVKGAKMSMRMMADDEEGEDEVYMAISQMLSANQNVDAVAMQKMNEDVAEENKRLAEENNDISQKFSTLETEHNALKEETEKLRKFKSDIETQNKKFAVESTLKDVADILPEDAMKECRDSAEKFSLDDIDIWKNEVKAKAFNFSKQIPEKRDYLWMALPNAGKPKKGDGLWD